MYVYIWMSKYVSDEIYFVQSCASLPGEIDHDLSLYESYSKPNDVPKLQEI